MMERKKLLNEIMVNANKVPIECQERILDVLKGMVFTKKCLLEQQKVSGEEKIINEGCLYSKKI